MCLGTFFALRAVACNKLHLRASAHYWHVSTFFNREFLGISYHKKPCGDDPQGFQPIVYLLLKCFRNEPLLDPDTVFIYIESVWSHPIRIHAAFSGKLIGTEVIPFVTDHMPAGHHPSVVSACLMI